MVSAGGLPRNPLYAYFWHFFPQAATVQTTSTMDCKVGFIPNIEVFAFKMSAASVAY